MTNEINEINETSNNPMAYIIMHNLVILGAYSRPEWAAAKVMSLLDEEYVARVKRAVQYKHQMPDGLYLLRDGYDPDTGEIDLLYHPTLEQITEIINTRSQTLGVTVAGIGSTTYALNVCPVVMDA